jgi:hypothetical protein
MIVATDRPDTQIAGVPLDARRDDEATEAAMGGFRDLQG